MTYRIGVDVGGTKCLAVRIDEHNVVCGEEQVATPAPDQLIGVIASLVRALGPADRVGVGVPGLITHDGVMRSSPNVPGARDVAIRASLREALGLDVSVANDATCAALAEWSCGSARDLSTFWMVTLGTGIGGGLVVNGSLFDGAQGFAGEIGHMVVEPGGETCGCGMQGCWERYASGTALAKAVGAATGEEVFARVQAGELSALRALESWSCWVGIGLANLTNAFDPEAFVLGGGVINHADHFLDRVADFMADATYASHQRRLPRVVAAQLGSRAGAIGAALLTRD